MQHGVLASRAFKALSANYMQGFVGADSSWKFTGSAAGQRLNRKASRVLNN